MFIDTARYAWFGVIAVVSCIILISALLLGFLGPQEHEYIVDYSYECPGESHIFTSACTGVQLGVSLFSIIIFCPIDYLLWNLYSKRIRIMYTTFPNFPLSTGFGVS